MKKRRLGKKKLILGLTGGFGCGKTTVAKIFRGYGAQVVDADRIAHKIISPPGKIYKEIVSAFGKDILKKNKRIDRNKLSQRVFNDGRALSRLNRITHPEIIRVIKERIKKSRAKVIVLDAPLLIEAGLKDLVDKLIVVKIDKKKQIARALKNRRFNKTAILKRISSQISLRDKLRLADFVIDNSGRIDKIKRQAQKIRRLWWRN